MKFVSEQKNAIAAVTGTAVASKATKSRSDGSPQNVSEDDVEP
jgi:hypothetical protein